MFQKNVNTRVHENRIAAIGFRPIVSSNKFSGNLPNQKQKLSYFPSLFQFYFTETPYSLQFTYIIQHTYSRELRWLNSNVIFLQATFNCVIHKRGRKSYFPFCVKKIFHKDSVVRSFIKKP